MQRIARRWPPFALHSEVTKIKGEKQCQGTTSSLGV